MLLSRCCLDLRILATSREPIGIPGEVAWRMPSLSLPPLQSPASDPQSLGQYEAVRLFVERAQAAAPGFVLMERNAAAITQICRRLDGMPLAIELAAASVRVLTVAQIAERLDDRFNLLSTSIRTAPVRHQTLRATIDWSYALLAEAERAVLRRLSVFAGGCALEAAEAVCADTRVSSGSILDLLSRLVDKSLVVTQAQVDGTRYHLLDTIRQYAGERLREADEEVNTQQSALRILSPVGRASRAGTAPSEPDRLAGATRNRTRQPPGGVGLAARFRRSRRRRRSFATSLASCRRPGFVLAHPQPLERGTHLVGASTRSRLWPRTYFSPRTSTLLRRQTGLASGRRRHGAALSRAEPGYLACACLRRQARTCTRHMVHGDAVLFGQ